MWVLNRIPCIYRMLWVLIVVGGAGLSCSLVLRTAQMPGSSARPPSSSEGWPGVGDWLALGTKAWPACPKVGQLCSYSHPTVPMGSGYGWTPAGPTSLPVLLSSLP